MSSSKLLTKWQGPFEVTQQVREVWQQTGTDESDRGLGAVFSQVVEGEECPVLYISRKL
ncbi:hypothetical protein PGIGA_G00048640 [Pangasianodon gigas]|uniref:Uncharacterized protein n=1 Tax=Pangasianodon gigas TaxID=30993 RepID=A0ACC5X328_PANGG|nr:hypothetical protein [Pangasianodon gigas]